MNKLITQKIADFTIELVAKGSKLVTDAAPYANENELIDLKILVGKILGEAIIVTKPIFDKYPEVLPQEIRDGSEVGSNCVFKP